MVLKAFYRFCVRILESYLGPFTIQLDVHENAAPCYHELVRTIQNHAQGLNIDDNYQIMIDIGGSGSNKDNNSVDERDTRAPNPDKNNNDDKRRVISDDLTLYQALQAWREQDPIPLVVTKTLAIAPTRKRPATDVGEDPRGDVQSQHKQKQTSIKDTSFKPPVLKWKPTMSIHNSAAHHIHTNSSRSRADSGDSDEQQQQYKRQYDGILPPPFTASSDETPSVRKDSGVSIEEEPARKKKQRLNLAEDSMHTRKLPEPPLHYHHHYHPHPQHHTSQTAVYWPLPPSPTAALLPPMPPIGTVSSSVTLPAISEMIRKPTPKTSDVKPKASPSHPRADHFVCEKIVDPMSGARCGQTFRRSYDLSRHQTIHLKDRPYCHCSFCGKKFTRMDALRRHERVQNHVAAAGQHGRTSSSNGSTSGSSSSSSSHGGHSSSTSPASRRIQTSQANHNDKQTLHGGARVNPPSSPTTTPPPSPHAHNAKGELQQQQHVQHQTRV